MGISEDYLEAIRKIPGVVQPRPPSPPHSSDGISEKAGDGAYSRHDEGSIAEKEYNLGTAGESGIVEILGEKEVGEKGRGFFSPDIVDKELRNLGARRVDEDEGLRDGPL